MPSIASVPQILHEAKNGRVFILIDDVNKGSEANLVVPAQFATPAAINFMALAGRGLICLGLQRDRAEQLGLGPMVGNRSQRDRPAFTVSIEARAGVSTGISAADRARTIAAAIYSPDGPDALVTPGHVFPLVARDGGVLMRANQTEAAVDIARLAGLNPSAVMCGIMEKDGAMAERDVLATLAAANDLKIGSVQQLVDYRLRHDDLLQESATGMLKLGELGQWRAVSFASKAGRSEILVLAFGVPDGDQPVPVHVHEAHPLEDLLDLTQARATFQAAMANIVATGFGIVLVSMGFSRTSFAETIAGSEQIGDSHSLFLQTLLRLGLRRIVSASRGLLPQGLARCGITIAEA